MDATAKPFITSALARKKSSSQEKRHITTRRKVISKGEKVYPNKGTKATPPKFYFKVSQNFLQVTQYTTSKSIF